MSETGASADFGVGAARGRVAHFPVVDSSWPEAPTATNVLPRVVEPPPKYRYGRAQPVKGDVPVQRSVFRTTLLQPMMASIEVHNNEGILLRIIESPTFGNYGADPNDPARFTPGVDPRTAICSVLAPYAAARCMGGRGYF